MGLFPNHEEIGAQSPNMFDLFHQCMTEAKATGKLRNDVTLEMAVQVLFTVFYGAFLTAQLYDSSEERGEVKPIAKQYVVQQKLQGPTNQLAK
jgi:hypothetical protein